MSLLLSLTLTWGLTQRTVIRLEDLYIQGNVKKPPLVELKASQLDQKVEEAALANLIRLEKDLIKPLSVEELRKIEHPKKN